MGILNQTMYTKLLAIGLSLILFSSVYGQDKKADTPSLGETFNAGAPEVEPVVVGREQWNDKPDAQTIEDPSKTNQQPDLSNSQSTKIDELDPLETQQVKPESTTLPLEPPKIKPATRIVRNFEGTLVFKPRKFGFAYDFPYQLENTRGKRLAFIDVGQLKAVDPQQYVGNQVNVMGKLESIEEGSDDRVIRARIIRPSN